VGVRQSALEEMGLAQNDEPAPGIAGRRVFVSGHTGFKGSWMVAWLSRLGCETTGYSLAPVTTSLFMQSGLHEVLERDHRADIRDLGALTRAMQEAEPELVIHMAAQSLVRRAHMVPVDTWATNVMGTVNVLEAARVCPSVRAILVVTTDKCYENREWHWGYREIDALGGDEPYSASKAGAELVVQSYRKAFFVSSGPLVATARAGNVIGGGDWNEDRLLPDVARAVADCQTLRIRSPNATRPWQHVLDCLAGYLTLAAKLLTSDESYADKFNFGPDLADNLSVLQLLERLQPLWPELNWYIDAPAHEREAVHETTHLYLDSSKARHMLGWRPRWDVDTALAATTEWYRVVIDDVSKAAEITWNQLDKYLKP
jgi:CDP-glucose 4,6-dehydratase